MSYDLVLWSSPRSVRRPGELWLALYRGWAAGREFAARSLRDDQVSPLSYDEAKALVTPLTVERMVTAFRKEFGDDVTVATGPNHADLAGATWELTLHDGAYYAHVSCRWSVTADMLTKLRRAALRARCSTYDYQTETLFEPLFDQ